MRRTYLTLQHCGCLKVVCSAWHRFDSSVDIHLCNLCNHRNCVGCYAGRAGKLRKVWVPHVSMPAYVDIRRREGREWEGEREEGERELRMRWVEAWERERDAMQEWENQKESVYLSLKERKRCETVCVREGERGWGRGRGPTTGCRSRCTASWPRWTSTSCNSLSFCTVKKSGEKAICLLKKYCYYLKGQQNFSFIKTHREGVGYLMTWVGSFKAITSLKLTFFQKYTQGSKT